MADLFSTSVFERLGILARPFVWGRKALHETVTAELKAAGVSHRQLVVEQQQALERLAGLEHEQARMTERHNELAVELTQLQKNRTHLEGRLDESEIRLRDVRESSDRERRALNAAAVKLKADLAEKSEAIRALQQTYDEQLHAYDALRRQFSSLEQHHGDTWTRFQLISRLLAAQPSTNTGRVRFSQRLSEYEAHVAQTLSWSSAESQLIAELRSIDNALDRLLGFPELSTHTIAGVVGGFNSGKSEFINSFILGGDIRLAIGVKPVTAMPSYVTASPTSTIRGFTVAGGQIELDVQDFKRMSHAFLKSFDFDLKRLMPFMCLSTRMDPVYFSQLSLLDTPGYNPPATASAYSRHDRRTAVQAAQQSDALLWLIGIDVTGTVPTSDIEFMRDIGLEHRPVYIVLNKADLRSDEDLREILDEVRVVLDQAGITIAGISAYSSTNREVLLCEGPSLHDFLALLNRGGLGKEHVTDRLEQVFATYRQSLQIQTAAIESQRQCVNELQLDALQFGGEEVYQKIIGRLNELDVMLNTSALDNAVQRARALVNDLRKALQDALQESAALRERMNCA